jgi:hypothetical protein
VPREPLDPIELEPGETILATAGASFRGAAAASVRATFAFGAGRIRNRDYSEWRTAAVTSGFPPVPDDMVVAVTEQRLLFGKARMPGRGRVYTYELPLERISQVASERHGMVVGLGIAMRGTGAMIELEAMRGRQLAHLADVLDELLTARR